MSTATVTPRPIGIEDLAVTLTPSGDTFSATVLGVGPGQTLTKIPITLLTQLKSAANDTAAAAAGVNAGQVYMNTTENALHALTGASPVGATAPTQQDFSTAYNAGTLTHTLSGTATVLNVYRNGLKGKVAVRYSFTPGTNTFTMLISASASLDDTLEVEWWA